MAKKSIYGSIRRFGSRHGRKTKFKVGHIESLTKGSTKCPYCRKNGVKKLAIGIFYCIKCKTKFTGRAYTPIRTKRVDQLQEQEEEIIEIEEPQTKEQEKKEKPAEAEPTGEPVKVEAAAEETQEGSDNKIEENKNG